MDGARGGGNTGWSRDQETKRPANARRQKFVQLVTATTLVLLCVSWLTQEGLGAERITEANAAPLAAVSDGEALAQAPQPIARIIQRLRPRTGVTALAWSPDGKTLATMGGLQERITLWNPRTGKMLWEKLGAVGGEAIGFSHDGRLLLTPTGTAGPEDEHTTLTLWDVATGTVAGRVAGPFPDKGLPWNYARRLALDREGGLLAVIAAAKSGSPVVIYDAQHWTAAGTVAVEGQWPRLLAFGPDGTLAVGMVGGKIALFDARTQTLKRIIATPRYVNSLAYSPDGKYLAVGYGPGYGATPVPIEIWSTVDGKSVRSFVASRAEIPGLAWSPDGRYLASASYDRSIRLWPARTEGEGQIVATFEGGGAWCVAFSPDGTLLAGGASQDDAIVAEIK